MIRLFAMFLGALIATALVVSMQLPLMGRASAFTTTARSITSAAGSVPPLAWPSQGSAALLIPSLGVQRTWHDRVVPIASLTKMMTAYVTLQALPLSPGTEGPCVTVGPADVATYAQMNSVDESSARVVDGEQLCEQQLLEGLLVHSAGNYAVLLSRLVSGSSSAFVERMNQTAAALGLSSTHYADESGFSSQSVSSALDQAKLARWLMKSALVRSIVIQPTVTLPVAGTLSTFTPLVGTDHVIGVKSGRTEAAGGCDVMAMTFVQGGQTRVIYAVILGQRSGNMLTPAGAAALALANSALANRVAHVFVRGSVVGRIGWGLQTSDVVVAHRATAYWWAPRRQLPYRIAISSFSKPIRRGEQVGWLEVRGLVSTRIELVAARSVSAPSIWQRLR
ncbi:MAG: D-alanyl-D-alanine carboxypeptidase [Acidimicrobiaceae bacterium]|nr:D-alanyl-D-alanine carboxypeptidase [Acidimicrobiaceae bacterium]